MTRRVGRELENRLLALMLLHEAQERGLPRVTRTKMHKLLFFAERTMISKRILASGLRFHKMPQGPWSTDVEAALTDLESAGLIESSSVEIASGDEAILTSLTEEGLRVADQLCKEITEESGRSILMILRETVDKFGRMSSQEMADRSHRMKNLVTGRTIGSIPHGRYVQLPIQKKRALMVLNLDGGVRESLEILFDPVSKESIERSIKSAQRGPLIALSSLDDLEAP